MTFSIRALLALTFVIALGIVVWQTGEGVRSNDIQANALRDEIRSLENRVRLDDPDLHQAILHTRDELEPLHEMRKRAVAHFDVLRDKYSRIEPRGPKTLSIRRLPSLQVGTVAVPTSFRMVVPEDRPMWLMFGVHLVQRNVHSTPDPSKLKLLKHSSFSESGPFEIQLEPGDQLLTVTKSPAKDGKLDVEIGLKDGILVRSTYAASDVSGTTSSHISAPNQIDFGPHRELPWLLTAQMSHQSPNGQQRAMTHAFSIWLSAQSNGYERFPGK